MNSHADECQCDAAAAARDWSAMRKWLMKARDDARRFALVNANDGYTHAAASFEGQLEIVQSALDFMAKLDFLAGHEDASDERVEG